MDIKTKIYTAPALFSIASLALIAFLIYPNFRDIKNSSLQIISNKKESAFIYAQNEELNRFKNNLHDYKVNLDKSDNSFIYTENPVDFIRFLEKISSELGIRMDVAITANPQNKGQNKSSVSFFQITTNGDFHDTLEFSKKMERGPYLLGIISVSLKKPIKNSAEIQPPPNIVESNFIVSVQNKTL